MNGYHSSQPILEAREVRDGWPHLNRVSYTIRKTARFLVSWLLRIMACLGLNALKRSTSNGFVISNTLAPESQFNFCVWFQEQPSATHVDIDVDPQDRADLRRSVELQ